MRRGAGGEGGRKAFRSVDEDNDDDVVAVLDDDDRKGFVAGG